MRARPATLRLLRRLVVLIGTAEDQNTLTSELAELYQHRLEQHGAAAADRWYRREVRRALWHLIADLARSIPRPGEIMSDLFRDLRHGVRRMARTPAFSLTVVLTLALGIGANTAVFTVVDGILLKPLPFHDPERLVGLWHTWPGQGLQAANMSPALYFTYREEGRVFEDVGMWDNNSVTVTGVEDPERVQMMQVTDGTLPILGVTPTLGRLFSAADDAPGAPPTAILSHGYWQQRFGGDPEVLGRALMVNGVPREIIGVLPADLHFLNFDPLVYLPFRFDRSEVYIGNFSFQGLARLRGDATLEEANADVDRLIKLATEMFPGTDYETLMNSGFGPLVRPLRVDVVGNAADALWVLLGTVGLVLLIACANVANLLLVRAEGRQRETAIRAALGASRPRLIAESLMETAALTALGGLAGLLLARTGVSFLLRLRPQGLPRLNEIGVDGRVVLFAAGVSLLAAVMAALLPLIRSRDVGIGNALADEGRGAGAGRQRHRARNTLVVCQMAMALVLLVGSGLMFRSVQALNRVDPGFSGAAEIQTVRLSIPAAGVRDAEEVVRQQEQILRAIEAISGVDSVGMASSITMDGWDSNDSTEVDGFPTAENEMAPSRRYKWISPGYFETMQNPLIVGRTFTWADVYNQTDVAIVTENIALEYWDSPVAALGQRLRENDESPWREIVGVVGNIRDDGIALPERATVFWPMYMSRFWGTDNFVRLSMAYAIRSPRVGTRSFSDEIRQAVWTVNPNLPFANVWTMDELVDRSMARTSFTLVMLSIAATAALLLGAVGIYGVTSYVVSLRTREIGVRMALGAQQRHVSRMVLRRALVLATVGIAVGIVGAFGLTRLMAALLFGVSPLDATTYGFGAAVIAALTLLASYLPARRAAGVDPIIAMRAD